MEMSENFLKVADLTRLRLRDKPIPDRIVKMTMTTAWVSVRVSVQTSSDSSSPLAMDLERAR